MAYNFFGVYFESENGTECRCGFHDDDNYQPKIERRHEGGWIEVNYHHGTGKADQACREIRAQLPIHIAFDEDHTQNERMELINQIVYNIYRHTTGNVNYGGAHT